MFDGLIYREYPNETVMLIVVTVSVLLTIIVPYLLGSLNSAIIVSRLFYGEDIRTKGSGNAGTTNVLRVYGKRAALMTLLGDILKTVISILFGGIMMGLYYSSYAFSVGYGGYIAGFFCIVGHIWPIYYRFRGGKGVLCLAVAVGVLSPLVLLPLLLIFAIIVAFTRYISLGSVIGSLIYPLILNRICVLAIGRPLDGIQTVISMLEAIVIVVCHRANLRRLLDGKENKFSFHSHEQSGTSGQKK